MIVIGPFIGSCVYKVVLNCNQHVMVCRPHVGLFVVILLSLKEWFESVTPPAAVLRGPLL